MLVPNYISTITSSHRLLSKRRVRSIHETLEIRTVNGRVLVSRPEHSGSEDALRLLNTCCLSSGPLMTVQNQAGDEQTTQLKCGYWRDIPDGEYSPIVTLGGHARPRIPWPIEQWLSRTYTVKALAGINGSDGDREACPPKKNTVTCTPYPILRSPHGSVLPTLPLKNFSR